MRRILACLMCVVLAVGMMPAAAFGTLSVPVQAVEAATQSADNPQGLQLNDDPIALETWKQSEAFVVRTDDLAADGVAVMFEGSVAPRLNLPKADDQWSVLILHTPSSVTWTNDAHTAGVAYYTPTDIFNTWSEAGYARTNLRSIRVQADKEPVTVNRIVLTGVTPPDVTNGKYGTGVNRKLLYTRPVTLVNPVPEGSSLSRYTVLMNTEAPDAQGKDLAVRFTGDRPMLSFIYYWSLSNDDEYQTVRCSGWEGWTDVKPYMVVSAGDSSGQRVAFFSHSDIEEAWTANTQVWADNHKDSTAAEAEAREHVSSLNNQNTHYNNMMVNVTSGTCKLVEVVALDVDKPAAPAMRAASDVRTGDQIISELGAGYNFGGSLESCLHMKDENGKDYITFNEKDGGWLRSDLGTEVSWGNPYLTEAMFRAVKQRGFNTVRIPVSWGQHIYPEGDPTCRPADSTETDPVKRYHIDEAWMERVHQVVDFALRNDLYVILNTHHEGWIDRTDMNTETARAEMVEELRAVWTQIAAEFEGYDQRLIFEGVNEPHATDAPDDREWNKPTVGDITTVNTINKAFVDLIHSLPAHRNRLLLCSTYGGHPELTHIGDYVLPDDGSGLVAVSTHPYTPYSYANDEATDRTYTGANRTEVDRVMEGVRATFTDKGIHVVFDEFGCRYCEDSAGNDGRLAWLTQYVTAAKSLGIPCVAWPLESSSNPTFFARASQTWPAKGKSYIDTWFGILADSNVEWGERASVCPHEHGAISSGAQLLDGERTLKASSSDTSEVRITFNASWNGSTNSLAGKEVAVQYVGAIPRLGLLTIKDGDTVGDWWGIEPSFVKRGAGDAGVAYYSAEAIRLNWTDAYNLDELMRIFLRLKDTEVSTIKAVALVDAGASGHEWTTRTVGATCLTGGTTETYCSQCGKVWKSTTGGAPLGHTWGAWTSLNEAHHQRTCLRESSHVDTGEHVWDSGQETPDATGAGTTVTYMCTVCGATKVAAGTGAGTGAGSGSGTEQQPSTDPSSPTDTPSDSANPGSGSSPSPTPTPTPSRINMSAASVKLSANTFSYDGYAKRPSVTVTYKNRRLARGKDYTLEYTSNKNVGAAKVTVTGMGSYKGRKSVSFKIIPKEVHVSLLTATARGFKAQWRKQTTQTTGYQLQYATKSNFKGAKSVSIDKLKQEKTVSKLKPSTKYYVRIRAYKKVGSTTYYATWSPKKAVTTL